MTTVEDILRYTFYLEETDDGWYHIMNLDGKRITTAKNTKSVEVFIDNYTRVLAEQEPTGIIK